MSDVTRVLSEIEAGDPSAGRELLPLVYEELRKLAAARLTHDDPGQTVQATSLVHEAYRELQQFHDFSTSCDDMNYTVCHVASNRSVWTSIYIRSTGPADAAVRLRIWRGGCGRFLGGE